MKKLTLIVFAFVIFSAIAIAQEQKGMPDQTGQQNMEEQQIQVMTTAQEQNQALGTQSQNQVQARIMAGTYTTENGKQLQIQAAVNNRLRLQTGIATAETAMELSQEQEKINAKLSNGKFAEIKIMPDTASETALARLRLKVCSVENNCTIELKEVGEGTQARAAYELQAQRQAKVFGLFKAKMQVQSQVDAETGELIKTKKAWWAFLATEPKE